MNEKRASLEVIAPNVDEAISKGLAELGLQEDAVEIEVLDAGSRGLFGLGFRQARVRLTIKAAPSDQAIPIKQTPVEPSVRESVPQEPSFAKSGRQAVSTVLEPVSPPAAASVVPQTEADLSRVTKSEKDENILRVARETVEELLEKMKVRAQVTARFGEADDAHSRTPLLVEVHGDDLSILIGPKAETLNALQYIAGLIIGKEVGGSVPLIIDVEGFRARRNEQIRRLALRMADQAIKTGRRQTLEPMPASERRLVHIELRNHPDVKTESIGEDPHRKVTILPR